MNQIPKIVHFIWVGDKKLPKKSEKFIQEYKKILGPKWKIKIHTNENIDSELTPLMKWAFKNKKWNVIGDVYGSYVIWKYGGFYFDTDVQLLKPLDTLLKFDFIASKTYGTMCNAGTFAGIKGSKIAKRMFEIYSIKGMQNHQPISAEILTLAIRETFDFPNNIDTSYDVSSNVLLLDESYLQLGNLPTSFSKHFHFAMWVSKTYEDNTNETKWYNAKLNSFEKGKIKKNGWKKHMKKLRQANVKSPLL